MRPACKTRCSPWPTPAPTPELSYWIWSAPSSWRSSAPTCSACCWTGSRTRDRPLHGAGAVLRSVLRRTGVRERLGEDQLWHSISLGVRSGPREARSEVGNEWALSSSGVAPGVGPPGLPTRLDPGHVSGDDQQVGPDLLGEHRRGEVLVDDSLHAAQVSYVVVKRRDAAAARTNDDRAGPDPSPVWRPAAPQRSTRQGARTAAHRSRRIRRDGPHGLGTSCRRRTCRYRAKPHTPTTLDRAAHLPGDAGSPARVEGHVQQGESPRPVPQPEDGRASSAASTGSGVSAPARSSPGRSIRARTANPRGYPSTRAMNTRWRYPDSAGHSAAARAAGPLAQLLRLILRSRSEGIWTPSVDLVIRR
jgi:hypothetical protein